MTPPKIWVLFYSDASCVESLLVPPLIVQGVA